MPHRVAFLVIATLFTFASMGCSPNMESTAPTPVDVDEFQIGQNRDSVLERLGAPESTATENAGVSCDFYTLLTKETGAVEKVPPAPSEPAPDAATWLANNLSRATESASKSEKRLVGFCYKDGRIVRINGNSGSSAASGATRGAAAVPLTQVSPGQSSAQLPSANRPMATP
jgi:hypothetical protein